MKKFDIVSKHNDDDDDDHSNNNNNNNNSHLVQFQLKNAKAYDKFRKKLSQQKFQN